MGGGGWINMKMGGVGDGGRGGGGSVGGRRDRRVWGR